MSSTRFQIRLFDSVAADRDLQLAEISSLQLRDDQLLWIDVCPPHSSLAALWSELELPDAALRFVTSGSSPALESAGTTFWLRVVAVSDHAQGALAGAVLGIAADRNRVVTVHAEAIDFIDAAWSREDAGTTLGRLPAESFVASLLDAQLTTYFSAAAAYEKSIDAIEHEILSGNTASGLAELRRLRQWASRFRRMLAPHRTVFGAMSRPDFSPSDSELADRHFAAIDTRFERAMDVAENTRELVLGSFELFSSQTALQTNQRMKALTFVTVITGALATLVGIMGMNFEAGFFETADRGFWIAIGGLATVTVAALWVGRWQKWF